MATQNDKDVCGCLIDKHTSLQYSINCYSLKFYYTDLCLDVYDQGKFLKYGNIGENCLGFCLETIFIYSVGFSRETWLRDENTLGYYIMVFLPVISFIF
jgi:hypothetical protein